MKYSKEIMIELAYEDHDPEKFDVIKNEITDTSRWENIYDIIFKDLNSGKLYSSSYSVGATESQPNTACEYDDEEIEVHEVEAHLTMVTEYRIVK